MGLRYRIIQTQDQVVMKTLLPSSTPKTMMILKQAGKLMRKPSGGERAWFLEEESEPRNKPIFLAETRRKIGGLTYQLGGLFIYHGF